MRRKIITISSALFFCSHSFLSYAAPAALDITQLTLEQLMETEVTSVSRTRQPLSETAAAVFVISEEDIRRSTAKSVPDLLRMVPGIQVAQITKNKWAVSARGFNSGLSNKLLVLIDGRSVYSPLYNQVYWDVQDMLLENIERIEVVRGPGGTVWGSNAVNGVINIITKHSKDTKGGLLKGGGGSERQSGAARYGGEAGEDFSYRVTGKYFNEESSSDGNDAWYLGRGSARADWKMDDSNNFMMSGDYYNGEEDIYSPRTLASAPFFADPFLDQTLSGGHALARWNHIFSETSDGTLQTYFDQYRREEEEFGETRYTWDLEWDHRFQWTERQEIVYGLGYRLQADDTDGSFAVTMDPENRTTNLLQGFIQDTIAVVPEKLWLTGGVKAEHNDFSGWEFMPTARALWNFLPEHSVWAAFSRAVRIPSRLEHDLKQANNWITPGAVRGAIVGDTTKEAEAVLAYEAGYRVQPHQRISIDTAVFYNDYSNLTTASISTPFNENGSLVVPVPLDDQGRGETYGVETAIQTEILEWWHFHTAYTFLEMQIHQGAVDVSNSQLQEGQNPEHQLHFRSLMNLPGGFELDSALRFVDRLNNTAPLTHSYWELDLRLGWQAFENLLLEVHGTSLLSPQHLEFPDSPNHLAQIERTVFAEATVSF